MQYTGILITAILLGFVPNSAFALSFENPLTFPFIQKILLGLVRAVTFVGFPVLVVLIVITGFLFIFAMGSKDGISNARSFAIRSGIVSGIFLSLWVASRLISGTIGALSVSALAVVIVFFLYAIFAKK